MEKQYENPTGLNEDLIKLDKTYDSVEQTRLLVTEKLKRAVDALEFSADSSKLLEAQMGMVNTLLTSLNHTETAISKRVGAKVKLVETSNDSKYGEMVTDILSKLTMNTTSSVPVTQIDFDQEAKRLEEAVASVNIDPISEKELRKDPNDYT